MKKISKKAQNDIKKKKGTKDDAGKVDLTLLDPQWLESVAKVLEIGKVKYQRGNWQLKLEPERIFAALLRHTWAVWRGEWLDKESGLPHTSHISCNCMFLEFYHRHGDTMTLEHDKG